jgi:hypothetical protein
MKIKKGIMPEFVWIDPPEGWRYGFPKVVDSDTYENASSLRNLCISLGYPEDVAEAYGEYFYVTVMEIDI